MSEAKVIAVRYSVSTLQAMTRTPASPAPYMETVRDDQGKKIRRQRKNGKSQLGWRLRVWDPRAGRQSEKTFWGTEREATRELDNKVREMERRTTPSMPRPDSVTVGEWVQTWLYEHYVWKLKPRGNTEGIRRPFATWKKAKDISEHYLLPALGERTKLRLITTDMLEDAIGGLTRKDGGPLAPSSKETVVTVAKAMFRDAVKVGVLASSSAANLQTSWGSGITSRTALIPSILEMEKLASAMDKAWPLPKWAEDLYGPNGEGRGDIIRLLAYTGMRISEASGTPEIAWRRDDAVILVGDTATESGGRREYRKNQGKTRAAVRPVAVIPQVVPVLERLDAIRRRGLELEPARESRRQVREADKRARGATTRSPNRPFDERWLLLVSGEQGGFQSYGHWRKKLALCQKLTGVDYDAHSLRHIFASILYAAGVEETVIAEQMGHNSVEVARRVYRHLFKVDRSEVARRISEKVAAITAAEAAAAETELAGEGAPLYADSDDD